MQLTRHATPAGPRWALDGRLLPPQWTLAQLLQLPASAVRDVLAAVPTPEAADGDLLAPVEPAQEVWASGVTYLNSRLAREAESVQADVYALVYDAQRPELFAKAAGWRVVGDGAPVRIRRDSEWNVPEPELTLVVNTRGEIVGYSAGNDMSSRDIEGANPLYLPQAKVYDGSCAVGPAIVLADEAALADTAISARITRDGATVWEADTAIGQMKRSLGELVEHLVRELTFPSGVFLMTGTGIVPPPDFTLAVGDVVSITVGELTLTNPVAS